MSSSGFWLGAFLAAQDARAAKLRRQLRAARRNAAAGHRRLSGAPTTVSTSAVVLRIMTSLVVIAGAMAVVRGGR